MHKNKSTKCDESCLEKVKYPIKKVNRLNTPLKLFVGYILITLVINLYGPWEYLNFNKLYVSNFIFTYLVSTIITYLIFVKTSKSVRFVISNNTKNLLVWRNGIKITNKSIVLSMLLFVIMILIKISEIGLPTTNDIFITMAEAYSNKKDIGMELNRSGWLFAYFSIVYVITVILGAYYFSSLNKIYRVLYVTVLLLSVIYNILYVGNQKALGDIIIYIASVAFIKFCQSGKRINAKQMLLISISICGCLLLFASILDSRMRLWGVEYYSVGGRATLNIDNWMLSLFDDDLKLGIGTFLYYISHGYYGLSLCLDLPFVWSYGYGSSFAVKELFNMIIPLSDNFIASYPIRMEAETHWDAYSNWHTIFPWLASDFTYVGAIVFLCMVMIIYALSWNRILRNGHWVNILMFSNINILLLYVPANNQLFQTRASVIVTILILLVWLFNHNVDTTQNREEGKYEKSKKSINN
ncbi:hypothetical protein [Pelosinus sp. UFO1]|uniref:hypothetical protein n=1 Tax=Pelosinus sp. UFO1 TaxID=484770 RepID=UPI0004D1FB13|nr:hypothetical protein [Pelosinus sp. UFO1]AIF53698.1 hypothetical protein UFO1_4155 [Pelosinus sp. UFO1]